MNIHIDFSELLKDVKNTTIAEALLKANTILDRHDRIVCSVSGGSDSDIMLDLLEKVKGDKQIKYVWYDTGLEYQATKDHLKYLEDKYGIEIERIKPKKTIPTCVAEYGVPFISKFVSDRIQQLQAHNFKWEDKPFEELVRNYPDCCFSLRWWCNVGPEHGIKQFNIDYNKWLKEFLISNPPPFRISNKCCYYAKKKTRTR